MEEYDGSVKPSKAPVTPALPFTATPILTMKKILSGLLIPSSEEWNCPGLFHFQRDHHLH